MKFSVLQWNVWYKESNQNIVEFLREQDADIICLQELTIEEGKSGHAPQYIAEQLGYEYYFKEIDLGDGVPKLANGIFSRFPVKDTKVTWINEPVGTGGYDDEYRALIQATITMGDKKIVIGTTHMSYTHRFEITSRKLQETELLVDEIAKHTNNFILTGDLNVTPDSPTIKSLEKYLKNASPDYQAPTWTTKPFSYNGFEETELKWRLDYIFSTPDLRLLSSEVLSTDYSDHLPVLSWFEIN